MTLIDLGSPLPTAYPARLLDTVPRRLALTLPELRLVAEAAGGAPLPFSVTEPRGSSAPEDRLDGRLGGRLDGRLGGRLGATPTSAEDAAYAAALASLRAPEESLAQRGLLGADGGIDEGLLGAVGLLASPEVALDLEVAAAGAHARAWHRQGGAAVATLATADGVVFELAWFPVAQWPTELARAVVLPEDLPCRDSAVGPLVDLPFELVDAAGEAHGSGRGDLLPVLVARHEGAVRDGAGRALSTADTTAVLQGLAAETRGRLRALLADVSGTETTTVGVVSWVLLADGWHALRPRTDEAHGAQRVEIRAVDAAELAAELAPVLAQVLEAHDEARRR